MGVFDAGGCSASQQVELPFLQGLLLSVTAETDLGAPGLWGAVRCAGHRVEAIAFVCATYLLSLATFTTLSAVDIVSANAQVILTLATSSAQALFQGFLLAAYPTNLSGVVVFAQSQSEKR